MDVDGFVDYLRGRRDPRRDYALHFLANQRVDLAGDAAAVETYCMALIRTAGTGGSAPHTTLMPVRYWERLTHRDGVWRSTSRQVIYEAGRIDEVRGGVPGVAGQARLAREAARRAGSSTLEELEGEAAIRRVLAMSARALDRQDRDLLLGCYHDDAVDDRFGQRRSPEELASYIQRELWDRTEWSMHFLGNILLSVDGLVADCETYCVEIAHRPGTGSTPAQDTTRPVRYLDRFERQDGAWRIASRLVSAEPGRADPISTVVELTPHYRLGRRDRQDPAYMRLHRAS